MKEREERRGDSGQKREHGEMHARKWRREGAGYV